MPRRARSRHYRTSRIKFGPVTDGPASGSSHAEGQSPRLGRRIAHFNRAVTNRVTRPLATRLPRLGIVVHRGRRTGVEYRTPVNVFRTPGGFNIALTYGRDADWVRNVMAAGGA